MRKRQVVIKRSLGKEMRDTTTTNSGHIHRNVRYMECQKNHAANLGGYALDGCREFMASGDDATNLALVCAACGCHRNFHRREVETEVATECSSS